MQRFNTQPLRGSCDLTQLLRVLFICNVIYSQSQIASCHNIGNELCDDGRLINYDGEANGKGKWKEREDADGRYDVEEYL